MSHSFSPGQGLVIVPVEVTGPSGSAVFRLAVDTGATSTVVNVALLVALGYDPALEPDRVQVTTGSGVEFAPAIVASRFAALGQTRTDFRVLGLTLPTSAGIDGLLGLDFFRGLTLVLDFRRGEVALQ